MHPCRQGTSLESVKHPSHHHIGNNFDSRRLSQKIRRNIYFRIEIGGVELAGLCVCVCWFFFFSALFPLRPSQSLALPVFTAITRAAIPPLHLPPSQASGHSPLLVLQYLSSVRLFVRSSVLRSFICRPSQSLSLPVFDSVLASLACSLLLHLLLPPFVRSTPPLARSFDPLVRPALLICPRQC